MSGVDFHASPDVKHRRGLAWGGWPPPLLVHPVEYFRVHLAPVIHGEVIDVTSFACEDRADDDGAG